MTREIRVLKKAKQIARELREAGASECLFVGGFVRDHLMGIPADDIDIEVYGLGYDDIVEALRPRHRVDLVGRSFGTVKVDNQIDINIPRRESKCGVGHRGFSVEPDPTMTPYEATARRDFTINAMAMRADGSFYDPFCGREDLNRKILRATTVAFCEDPLRVLRGMQFAARFGFRMDPATVELCRKMVGEYPTLSRERVWAEWKKWAAKGDFASIGLEVLAETGWVRVFPTLAELGDLPARDGGESSAWTATCRTCDCAAQIAVKQRLSRQYREVLLFAALLREGSRAAVGEDQDSLRKTKAVEDTNPVLAFLEHLGAPNHVVAAVEPLVYESLRLEGQVAGGECSPPVVRWLARRLSPSTIRLWADLHRAAHPQSQAQVQAWLDLAATLGLVDSAPEPLVRGRDMLPMGYGPGPHLGGILREAFDAQLDGAFASAADGLEWVLRHHPPDTPPKGQSAEGME